MTSHDGRRKARRAESGSAKSRADVSEKRQLTPAGVYSIQPRWSPDGSRIAYVAQGPGEDRFSLRLVRSDGSGDAILWRPEPLQDAWVVCWLPDGESVVFSHLDPSRPGVFTLALRTRHVTTLPGAENLM